MKLSVRKEPMLQFCKGTHIDIRAGLATHGAFDRDSGVVPTPIRIGVVGTASTVAGVRRWIANCRGGVKLAKQKRPELHPDFPGMTKRAYGTQLELAEATTRPISRSEMESALRAKRPMDAVVNLFLDHARDLAGRGTVQVLVIAPPGEVFTLADEPRTPPEVPFDEGSDTGETPSYVPSFHDLFKARALELAVPCQLSRPSTYDGDATRGGVRPGSSLQDEATRAWNFHTALYYKAGGVPWRLVRRPSAYTSCYIGTSFFKSTDGDRMLTSVAQVFDERGEGLIVQGGNARIDKNDRSPHLSAEDAQNLLTGALAIYRREHGNTPARVLVHKTSYFDDAEIEGCRAAAQAERIEMLELVGVKRSGVRLLRGGALPPLRGTTLSLDERTGLVYLRGSVPYYRMYPGMYIPSPIEFVRNDGESTLTDLAQELLELSKLNFNNTQFDGGEPITVRAARRVGDILKHVGSERIIQSRFRYFT
jgi:hypothetical protein